MKKFSQSILLWISLFGTVFCFYQNLSAIDYNSQQISHPHGILSDTPETVVNKDQSKFTISGGIQNQNTLFHQFQQFNIHKGESAIFDDAGFDHTVAQVTGTDYSWINGQLTSSSNHFFLINANGIIFGPDVSLNVSGSFHASTANEVFFSDKHLEDNSPSSHESLLNIWPIVSFGFLTDNVSSISISGPTKPYESSATGLHVKENQTISLISGDILISDNARIKGSGGSIGLVSVNSKGSVYFFNNTIQLSDFSEMGKINLSNQSILDASGSGGGNIFIRSKTLNADNSRILAVTDGSIDGGLIDINVDHMSFTNGAFFDSSTNAQGDAGTIKISSIGDVVFDGENEHNEKSGVSLRSLYTETDGGNAGTIIIEANKVSFLNGASIDSATLGTGNGGEINIQAKESITISGKTSLGKGSHFEVASLYVLENAGRAGSIVLEAQNIHFGGRAFINSTTDGPGMSGHVSIKAHETFSMHGEEKSNSVSLIIAGTWLKRSDGGQGGDVIISAKNLDFKNNVMINTSTSGEGDGGKIEINITETASFDNNASIQVVTSSKRELAGNGGNLHLTAKNLILKNGSIINSTSFGHGKAGQVHLEVTDHIILEGNMDQISAISGEVSMDSNGGNGDIVQINSGQITLLDHSMITTTSSSIGNAGNIIIHTNALSLCGKSAITSRSKSVIGGNAGNINITTQFLALQGSDAIISTSSNGSGKGGSIIVNSEIIDSQSGQISSESLYKPDSQFKSYEQFQKNFLSTGDIVQFPNGTPLTRYYVYNNQLRPMTNSMYIVDHIDDVNNLGTLYDIKNGDIAWVKNSNAAWTQYIYSQWYLGRAWTPVDLSKDSILFTNVDDIYRLEGVFQGDDLPPYPNGAILTFKNTSTQQTAIFIYCHADHRNDTGIYARPVQLNQFSIQNVDQLSQLNETYLLNDNAFAVIQNESGVIETTYLLHSDQWIQLNTIRNFDNPDLAIEHLSQSGDISVIQSEEHRKVFTGNEWIDLQNIHSIDNQTELSLLNAVDGDIAQISQFTEDNPSTYVRIHHQWIPFFQSGDAGTIDIQTSTLSIVDHSSISTSTTGNGQAGNIGLYADRIVMDHHSNITSESHALFDGGQAGSVQINEYKSPGYLKMLNDSAVLTDSVSSGGGKISIKTDEVMLLNSDITTNVNDGLGNGGDVTIESKLFVLNKSNVTANAIDGDGGAIFIVSDHFIKSSDTIIEASSERGNEGSVKIEAPDLDIDSKIINLPTDFLNASRWIKTPCSMRDISQTSRLVVRRHAKVPSIMHEYLFSSPGL